MFGDKFLGEMAMEWRFAGQVYIMNDGTKPVKGSQNVLAGTSGAEDGSGAQHKGRQ